MRRKDREVRDEALISEIIRQCHCCRLGFCEDGEAYIVPLNFGCKQEAGERSFYFHSAGEGRKIDLIRKAGVVGFEMDTGYCLNEGEIACAYSAAFQSIIGRGRVSFVETMQEKQAALQCIMHHSTGRDDWFFSDDMLHQVCVFKLEVIELSCKVHE